MENWITAVDESSGQSYYYNTVTQETSWEIPTEFVDLNEPDAEISGSDWTEVYDEVSGTTYYFNPITQETSWDNPAADARSGAGTELVLSLEQPSADYNDYSYATDEPASTATVSSDWAEVFDEASETYYYYNATTQETSWDRPADYSVVTAAAGGREELVEEEIEAQCSTAVAVVDATQSAWEPVYDEASNSYYFYNSVTQETSWEDPRPSGSSTDYAEERTVYQDKTSSSESKSPAMNMSLYDSPKLNLPIFPRGSVLQTARHRSKQYISAPAGVKATGGNSGATPGESSVGSAAVGSAEAGDDACIAAANEVFRQITPELQPIELVDILLLLDTSWLDCAANVKELLSLLSAFRMEKFAETYFQYDRRGINNLNSVLDKLLSCQMEPLKQSLTLLSPNFSSEALVCFRYIMGFMDSSKTIHSAASFLELASNLIRKMLNASAELHDEIYCQLCKQIRKNPSSESAELGCQLILICLISFSPSKRLLPYMMNYCCSHLRNPSSSEGTKKFLRMALKLCIKASLSTTRKELPTDQEVQSLILGDLTEVEVQTIDGQSQHYLLDSFTTMKQLEFIVCEKLGIEAENRPLFSIFDFNIDTGEALSVNPSDRVLDVVSVRCQRQFPEFESIGVFTGASPLKLTQFNSRTQLSGMAGGQTPTAANGASTAAATTAAIVAATTATAKSSCGCFLFKVSHYLPVNYFGDKIATQLFYTQATHDVITGYYPHTVQDAIILAAIQMQEQLGDHTPGRDLAVLRGRAISKYMYKTFFTVSDHFRSEIETKIMQTYKALAGMSPTDAQIFYISFVRSWKTYGATFFMVTEQEGPSGAQAEDIATELVLAVTAKQLLLIDKYTSTFVAEYGFEEILSWGHSFDSFVLVSGSKSSHVKSYFKTLEGKEIDDLLKIYQSHKDFDYDAE